MKMLRQLWRFLFGWARQRDLSALPLPLYLREAEGNRPSDARAKGGEVIQCALCGVRYFRRPLGAAVREDGLCWSCSTGAPRAAPPTNAEVEIMRSAEAGTRAARAQEAARQRFFREAKRLQVRKG